MQSSSREAVMVKLSSLSLGVFQGKRTEKIDPELPEAALSSQITMLVKFP